MHTLRLFVALVSLLVSSYCFAGSARLDVPLVEQADGRLCGPAAVEMVYRYFGEERFDQYDIARKIATDFSSEARFKENVYATTGSAGDYPGTPAYILRQYLEGQGDNQKYSLKELPSTAAVHEQKFQKAFAWIKRNVARGVPVIVHQYWASPSSTGHYRVVTGFDDEHKRVYLNDAKAGKVVQSYAEFKKKGAYPGTWMPYYSLAFKPK